MALITTCTECDKDCTAGELHDYFECLREKVRRGVILTMQEQGSLIDYGVRYRATIEKLVPAAQLGANVLWNIGQNGGWGDVQAACAEQAQQIDDALKGARL